MNRVRRFLEMAQEVWPTTNGAHHSVTVPAENENRYNTERVVLTLFLGNRVLPFYVTDDEFENPAGLIEKLKQYIAQV